VRKDELVCEECRTHATGRASGWRGYLIDVDDDGADEVVFYCPRCAAREFGKTARESRRPPAR
jgi:hypothetical protein